MLKLYKFFVDFGRMGQLDGLFIADSNDVNDSIGKDVYFGDALGKHSDIGGELEEDHITMVSEDQDLIERLLNVFRSNTLCGYNPLHCIDC